MSESLKFKTLAVMYAGDSPAPSSKAVTAVEGNFPTLSLAPSRPSVANTVWRQ